VYNARRISSPNKADGSENAKYGRAVRCSLEVGIFVGALRCEADLHRGQHQGHEDGISGHPRQVVAEKAAVVVPAAEVWRKDREVGEAVDPVQPEKRKLGAMERGCTWSRSCFSRTSLTSCFQFAHLTGEPSANRGKTNESSLTVLICHFRGERFGLARGMPTATRGWDTPPVLCNSSSSRPNSLPPGS
jgi:hypothetical protein